METAPDPGQLIAKSKFAFKSWLAWFFLLLLPQAIFLAGLIQNQSSFLQTIFVSMLWYFEGGFFLLPFFAGVVQWFYLRTRLPRAIFWVPLQMLVYTMVLINLDLSAVIGFYNFARNISIPERWINFCQLLLFFLLPGALLHFVYFRVKHVRVSWSWFRDYALVFALGAMGYLFYDALRFEQPPFISSFRGQHYFDLSVFIIYTSTGVAWVMSRVPFPEVVKTPKHKKNLEPTRTLEKYRKKGTFPRLMFWFNGLFIPGMILFITFTELMMTTPDGLTSIVAISIASSFFIITDWWLFRCLAPVSKINFILPAIFIPIVFLVGLIPGFPYAKAWTIMLMLSLLALLAVGLFQQFGLRRIGIRINRFYFLYLLAAFLLCLLPLVVPEMPEDVRQALELLFGLAFPILCSVFLSVFIRPTVFPPVPKQVPVIEKDPNQIPEGEEK